MNGPSRDPATAGPGPRSNTVPDALETRLRQAQKLEAVGRLAGGVAHEFNNLLTAIVGQTDQLLDEHAGDPALVRRAGQIREAARRATELTQQLLAFARKQLLEPRVLNLDALLADLHPMLQLLLGESIELVTTPAATDARVHADPGRLEQVLVDLALHARDAMPRGGRLTIATRNVAREDEGAGALEGPLVQLTLSDTGAGMDPEALAHLFEPFFSTRERSGAGLGLATVYGTVRQTGGSIWVSSRPGQGTSFRIYLPCASRSAGQPAGAPAPARTVLLVEDERAVRGLIAEVLRGGGFEVLSAASGEEALALMAGWAGVLDLLVTDVVMPGMSGRELARRLVAHRPGLRVLYVSGYSDEAIGPVLEPGRAFLQKPFAPAALLRTARELLPEPAGS